MLHLEGVLLGIEMAGWYVLGMSVSRIGSHWYSFEVEIGLSRMKSKPQRWDACVCIFSISIFAKLLNIKNFNKWYLNFYQFVLLFKLIFIDGSKKWFCDFLDFLHSVKSLPCNFLWRIINLMKHPKWSGTHSPAD